MFVKLAPERRVLDPITRRPMVDGVGREVPQDGFWMQRLAHGDVLQADPEPEQSDPTPPEADQTAPEADLIPSEADRTASKADQEHTT